MEEREAVGDKEEKKRTNRIMGKKRITPPWNS